MQKVLSNTRKLSTYLFILASLLGCGESELSPEPAPEELIPPSEVGAGFVSCLIDGEVWNVRDQNNRQSVGGSLTAGTLSIRGGRRGNSTEDSIIIDLINVNQENTFPIKVGLGIASYNTNTILQNGSSEARGYETNERHEGTLTVTFLDLDRNIVSGTFSFNAQDPVSGEIIQVRDGRFDFIY